MCKVAENTDVSLLQYSIPTKILNTETAPIQSASYEITNATSWNKS